MFMEVTKETTLGEIIEIEGVHEVLSEHHVPCVTCPFARAEMDLLKIGEICESYGIDCEALLKDLNGLVKKGGKKIE